MTKFRLAAVVGAAALAVIGGAATAIAASPGRQGNGDHSPRHHAVVGITVLSPRHGDNAGIAGKAAPFPGAFSPGQDDRLPGLVVLSSTTTSTVAGFSGPGTNLANLFNVTSLTDRSQHHVRIQDTWIVGAPIAGVGVDTTLTIAVVGDLNHDSVYNDAPAVITDTNHDGRIDGRDLQALGVVGHVETVRFHLDGANA